MPPSILTPTLLSFLRTHPHLPPQTWYFVAGVTFSVLNRPEEVAAVFRHAVAHDAGMGSGMGMGDDERVRIARRMREALVKGAVVGGLPKTINSLLALKKDTPPSLLDQPLTFSPTSRAAEVHGVPSSKILHRGQVFFDKIYGKVSRRVMGQMDRCGTEDLGITARILYGYMLSNTSVLNATESSYVLLAGLIPQDVNPQLKGHLKGALNNGATIEEVRAVREIVIKICEASGMTKLEDSVVGGWGWRDAVANL